jgi:hypothetical protein
VYFLVIDGRRGGLHVFLRRDPLLQGALSDDPLVLPRGWVALDGHESPDGSGGAESWLGQDPDDPSRYRVFRSRAELADAGFRPWRGPLVLGDWSDYRPHARA